MAQPIVKIRGVSKSFGSKLVLDNINLDINEGEVFGIIGASGAGKTTLLGSLIGYLPLNKGEVAFRTGKDGSYTFLSFKTDPDIKKTIGFSTQDTSFYDRLTVRENLEYFATLYDIPKEFIPGRIDKIIELVDLKGEENTLGGELSGGMQKRLDIACSLVNDPQVLILDEPTADLDPILRKHIWALIQKINSLGKTVIISSHFLEEMDLLCDRIAIIYDKTIAHIGSADELRKDYECDKEIVLETESKDYKRIAQLIMDSNISKIAARGKKMVVYSREPEPVLRKMVAVLEREGEKVLELEIKRPSLNEVFTAVVGKKEGAE